MAGYGDVADAVKSLQLLEGGPELAVTAVFRARAAVDTVNALNVAVKTSETLREAHKQHHDQIMSQKYYSSYDEDIRQSRVTSMENAAAMEAMTVRLAGKIAP